MPMLNPPKSIWEELTDEPRVPSLQKDLMLPPPLQTVVAPPQRSLKTPLKRYPSVHPNTPVKKKVQDMQAAAQTLLHHADDLADIVLDLNSVVDKLLMIEEELSIDTTPDNQNKEV
jgi:hypothetical protein